MRDDMDDFVRQALKNWTAEQQPPRNGRSRLLLIAASLLREQPGNYSKMERQVNSRSMMQSPLDQAIQIHELPWLWVAHIALTPIRRVT